MFNIRINEDLFGEMYIKYKNISEDYLERCICSV